MSKQIDLQTWLPYVRQAIAMKMPDLFNDVDEWGLAIFDDPHAHSLKGFLIPAPLCNIENQRSLEEYLHTIAPMGASLGAIAVRGRARSAALPKPVDCVTWIVLTSDGLHGETWFAIDDKPPSPNHYAISDPGTLQAWLI